MKDDEHVIHKYYAPFLPPKNHEGVYSGSDYYSAKKYFVVINHYFYLSLNKLKSFEWKVSLLFFVLNAEKLSLHMYQISEHINSSH